MSEINFPEIEELPVSWGYFRDFHSADRHKAIVDRDTGKLFSIVSQDYKLVRHEQAIDQIEEVIDRTPGLGEYKVTTEFYNDGGRMRRKYVFSEISISIEENDRVKPRNSTVQQL